MWWLERRVINSVFLLVYESDEENCKDDRGDLSLLVKNVRMSGLTPILKTENRVLNFYLLAFMSLSFTPHSFQYPLEGYSLSFPLSLEP